MLKRLVTFSAMVLLILITLNPLAAQQPNDGENEFRLGAVNPRASTLDTLTASAGRGIWVADNPDLDGDGKPEIIVTEYTKGGRVFVYEVIGNDQLEFVWASKRLSETRSGGNSTPRMVTTGDFDNDGFQEIIFPIGYVATDSVEAAERGIYFYEFTGTDNDYGSEPAYHLKFEDFYAPFATINQGATESGIRVQDIDGDGKSELLFPPRQAPVFDCKLFILEVESGTFENGDAQIDVEYTYEGMVQPSIIAPDSYTPCGTEIGDVDGDGLDEIIVTGWTTIGAGAGVGFIEIAGPDTYVDGSVVKLATYSAFVVKSKPIFRVVNGESVIYLHGTNAGSSTSEMWVMAGIISDQLVSESNIFPLFPNRGFWSAWDLGNQDHAAGSAQGEDHDLYLYGGSGRVLDVEYDGSGDVTDTTNYSITQLFDLSDIYDNVGGLFNDFYTYPGMDLDNDGLSDIVAAYKGSGVDTLYGMSLAKNGLHVFFFEWGDSSSSIDPILGLEPKLPDVVMPDDYQLLQNYPNPFNPATTIDFVLPINKTVSLKVYNTLGQEVRTLIDHQPHSAGRHRVQWDGTNNNGVKVASGVYVYELIYGNFSQSRKMTLLR